jgi:hypothetical protein
MQVQERDQMERIAIRPALDKQPTIIISRPVWHAPVAAPRERWLARWWATPAAYPVVLFAFSRALFLGITYAAGALLASQHNRMAGTSALELLQRWDQWDARWFVGIAQFGYTGYRPGTSAAYYPLMPLATHLVAVPLLPLFGTTAYLIAGVLVSNAAFLGALLALHALVRREYSTNVANAAVLFLAVYPKSLFTFTAYSESLFLLTSIAAILYLRRGQFIWAGALIGLATLDRAVGVVLAVPFVIEMVQHAGRDWRAWLKNGWPLMSIPAALGAYMLYLHAVLGDPFAAQHAELYWRRTFTLPVQTIWVAITNTFALPFGSTYQFNRVFDLAILALGCALLAVPHTPWGRRQHIQMPLSMQAYGWVALLFPLTEPIAGYLPDYISSFSRYALAAFPLFIILAQLTERRPCWHEAILVTSVALLLIFTVGFLLGSYVI